MAAKTPTLEDIADAELIPHDVELRCIVRNRTFLKNINGIDFSLSGYRSFIGLLKGNGRLYFNGEGFRYPSTAARAVRAEIEGRNVSATNRWLAILARAYRDSHTASGLGSILWYRCSSRKRRPNWAWHKRATSRFPAAFTSYRFQSPTAADRPRSPAGRRSSKRSSTRSKPAKPSPYIAGRESVAPG